MPTGLCIIIEQIASSKTIPRTCGGFNGPLIPTLFPKNHCLSQRKNEVNALAERRERERPSGPPRGGILTGIIHHQSPEDLENTPFFAHQDWYE
ncbi:MAG: hypothetical protein CXT70_03660 [Methanobacteriota archaeon]|nr:MAG: hypothetical protein CXT70_03660 [Euryarchaeota archaeon]